MGSYAEWRLAAGITLEAACQGSTSPSHNGKMNEWRVSGSAPAALKDSV